MGIDPDAARLAAHQRRLSAREAVPLYLRLRACETRLEMRSTVGAKSYESRSGDWRQSMAPPGVDAGDELTELGMGPVDALMRPVRNAIVELERALDFDDGYTEGRSTTTLMAHEKDHELVARWRGVRSETVARFAPYLGTQRAVELARRRLGVDPVTGHQRKGR